MPYSISQIPELSRLNVDTIASTAILSIDKKTGTYTITDKENRYNPIKDIKEQELAQKLQDANTLAEMKAYCLIPQIELMRTLI